MIRRIVISGFLVLTMLLSAHASEGKQVDISKLRKITQVSEFQIANTDLLQRGAFVATYEPTKGEFKGKQVIVFGSLHSSYKDGIPFKMIHKLMASLPQDAQVLYESTSFGNRIVFGKEININESNVNHTKKVYEPSWWDKIIGYFKPHATTEMGLFCYEADKRGISFACADLPYDETMQFLRNKGYSEEDIFGFGVYLGSQFLGYPTFTKSAYDYVIKSKIKKNLDLKAEMPFEGILEFFNFKKGDMMFFEHIYVRDQHALTTLFESLKTHNTVIIAFGGWHWNLWQDVLEQHLGAPKIQYYTEFLSDSAQ